MFTYTGFLESLVWTKHVTTIQTWKWKRTTTTNMAQFTGWFGRRHVVPIWKMSSQELRRPEHQFNNGKDVSLVISTKLGYIFLGKLSHISLPDSYRATISIGPIFFSGQCWVISDAVGYHKTPWWSDRQTHQMAPDVSIEASKSQGTNGHWNGYGSIPIDTF